MAKEEADAIAEKKLEKVLKIQANIKSNAQELTEKARAINQKWRKKEKSLENHEQQKKIVSLKHRELDNLRFEDLNENLEIMKSEKVNKAYKIGEKHMALTVMISDKKNYLNSANDKMRCRIIKERQLVKSEEKPYIKA